MKKYLKQHAATGKQFSKKTIYLLMALCAAIVLPSCGDDDDKNNDDNVPPAYFYFAGHSYLIVKEGKNWQDADKDAKAKGGYLVEIDSLAEQNAVYNAIKASVSPTYIEVPDGGGAAYVWIGGTDYYIQEGTWIWYNNPTGKNNDSYTAFWSGGKNGFDLAYANWGVGEPDNYTNTAVSPNGQDFAAIGLETWPKLKGDGSLGKAGEWNDLNGENRLYYVIEFEEANKGQETKK
jgi:hypothetical protein